MDRLTLRYLVLQKLLRNSLKSSNFEELNNYLSTNSVYLSGISDRVNKNSFSPNLKILNKKKKTILDEHINLLNLKTSAANKEEYLKKEKDLKILIIESTECHRDDCKLISRKYNRLARRFVKNGQTN